MVSNPRIEVEFLLLIDWLANQLGGIVRRYLRDPAQRIRISMGSAVVTV